MFCMSPVTKFKKKFTILNERLYSCILYPLKNIKLSCEEESKSTQKVENIIVLCKVVDKKCYFFFLHFVLFNIRQLFKNVLSVVISFLFLSISSLLQIKI